MKELADRTPGYENHKTKLDPRVYERNFRQDAIDTFLNFGLQNSCVYAERIDEHFNFLVWLGSNIDGMSMITCQIRSNLSGEVATVGELQFKIDETHHRYDLGHRLVATKEFGISGSDFLAKTEKVILRLFETDVLRRMPLYINAGQIGIIKWAQENGYQLNEESQIRLDHIRDNPEQYVTDITIQKNDDDPRTGYVFGKVKLKEIGVTGRNISVNHLGQILPLGERFSLTKELTT